MKIGIIGTRGIPNYYGGFEECAQQVGTRLAARGHHVVVYNSHNHPYQQKNFEGVEIIHKYDPEHRIGTFGQFIYDFNCILDARWRNYDVILMLGYTSSSIWQRFLPQKAVIITNMDGLEWKRSKYSSRVQRFLRKAESWATKTSDVLIADSMEIQRYLNKKYNHQVIYIPYGSEKFRDPDPKVLEKYGVEPGEYNLLISRLEPENSIETILNGIRKSSSPRLMLVVGNHETPYGEYLKRSFQDDSRIRFIKATYKKETIFNLRYFSNIFFHGHTVGGTNPSLLEAMGCSAMICAHDNRFNREVLGDDATYFMDVNDVANAANLLERNDIQIQKIKNNLSKLKSRYNWDLVSEQYEVVFQQAIL